MLDKRRKAAGISQSTIYYFPYRRPYFHSGVRSRETIGTA
jgi:hypothetical protein